MSTPKEAGPSGRTRRIHSAEFKAQVVAACSVPGVSKSAVAMAHGINDNLARRWVVEAAQHAGSSSVVPVGPRPVRPSLPAFVPLQVPAPVQESADIRIELKRGPLSIHVSWPCSAAEHCATWIRELLG